MKQRYKHKQYDALAIFVSITLLSCITGLFVDVYRTWMFLQEVQKLEQKCIEQQGVPNYRVQQATKDVKAVLCKKDNHLYEEF